MEKNKELTLEAAKAKLEKLASEFEKDAETEKLSVVLFVLAGSTLLGKEAIESLTLWNATWADSVINEVDKIREEDKVNELTDKIVHPTNDDE